MKNNPKLPANVVYERGMNFGTRSCFSHMEDATREQIDWNKEIDVSENVLAGTRTAATQFHYANTSHLILCGKLIKQELGQTSADLTKMAVHISAHTLDNADIWGRYIEQTDARENISRPIMTYYQQLFSESDALPLLIGMQTLAGPTATVLYDSLQHVGDPLFRQITSQMADQKQNELPYIVESLRPEITALTGEELEHLRACASQYSAMTEDVLAAHTPHFNALDLDETAVAQQVTNRIQQFYEDLGITD